MCGEIPRQDADTLISVRAPKVSEAMSMTQTRIGWLALVPLLVAVAVVGAACSSAATGTAAGAGSGSGASAEPVAASTDAIGATAATGESNGTGGADGQIDPCIVLTKADVQPFFSIPLVTQLPQTFAAGKTCEWDGNDGAGGVATALDVNVQTGQDATDSWSMATGPGSGVELFSGVGSQAEHFPGSPDFVSIKGTTLCGITTTGFGHLAGKSAYQPGSIPDAAATQIAQDYGTLCNRIFGSGNTTPTLVASPAASAAPTAPRPSISIPAVGGTLGNGFPLPQGLDCTGNTTTSTDGTITCDAKTTADPFSTYPFYLGVLSGNGYTINHEQEEAASDGSEVASIVFSGNSAGILSTISVRGANVTIILQAP